jgi:hypothetical protein
MGFWMEGMRGWMGRVKAQGTFANVHESLHLGMSSILKDDPNIPRSPGLRGGEFLGLHLKNGRDLMDSNLDCKGLNYMFCKKVLQFCDVTRLLIIHKRIWLLARYEGKNIWTSLYITGYPTWTVCTNLMILTDIFEILFIFWHFEKNHWICRRHPWRGLTCKTCRFGSLLRSTNNV